MARFRLLGVWLWLLIGTLAGAKGQSKSDLSLPLASKKSSEPNLTNTLASATVASKAGDRGSLIGSSKSFVGQPEWVNESTMRVRYLFVLTNYGSENLTNVGLEDDLGAVFGPGRLRSVQLNPATPTSVVPFNKSYTGTGKNIHMLATGTTLGARQTMAFVVTATATVSPGRTYTFSNMAWATATNATTLVTDNSMDGLDPDPDKDGDPTNNSSPTVFTVTVPNSSAGTLARIGLAMMVQDTTRQANGSYDVTYRLTVKNYSSLTLTAITISDTLANAFNPQTGASYRVLSRPSAPPGSRLKLNPGYNGGSDPVLVLGDSTSRLGPDAADTLWVRVNVVSSGQGGTFFSSAYVSTRAGATLISDVSTNGLNPDPNGNNDPTEPTERVPTPLRLGLAPDTIFIPEGFSPNGDGINDVFVISGVPNLTVRLEVFNRWGHRVYLSNDYQNDWDGTANTGVQPATGGGNALPDGTYYYVVRLSNDRSYIRYLTLQR